MKIELYKSALCPRCAYAGKILKKLQKEDESIEIITYDIATNIKAFKDASITIIPSIKLNSKKQSWILPKEDEIKKFISKYK